MSAFLLLACSGTIPDDDAAGRESAPTEDSGTPADTDSGTPGEVFELGDPSFVVDIGGAAWSSVTGYWAASVRTIRAEKAIDSTTSEIVYVEVDGELSVPGTYPIDAIQYVRQVSQAGDAFHYTARSPANMTLTVRGFAEGDALFAETAGTATMSDSVKGGSTQLTGMVIESWPAY